MASRSRNAFSLVELMVVLAIVALLLALLMPSLAGAREQVRRVLCANNLRQWGVALTYYREDNNDYLPTEGSYLANGILDPQTWYNTLPPYLGMPSYRDVERTGALIREMPDLHVWICPSKNATGAYKSGTGKNQFHYGMNQVLDGLGKKPNASRDTPGFPDHGSDPIRANLFNNDPRTVFLFDIADNSPAGSPRGVANKYRKNWQGRPTGKFHGDYANLLFISGSVGNCTAADLVADRDFRRGKIYWNNPDLYWGYRSPE